MSDDLIGFMNWVVIKIGYRIESYCFRGVVYDIIFEFLKCLYVYIMGVYEDLDNYFIYKYLYVFRELFELKLKYGKCYLDELLEGMFLIFKFFKGFYLFVLIILIVILCVKL